MSEKNGASHNPSHSYDLARKSRDLEERRLVSEQHPIQQKNLTTELIQQLQSDCLNRELEETLEGTYMIIHWPFQQCEATSNIAFSIFAEASSHMCPLSLLCIAVSLVSQIVVLFQFQRSERNSINIHE